MGALPRLEVIGRTRRNQPWHVTRTPFGHDQLFVTAPARVRPGDAVRAVLYFHGAGGGPDSFATEPNWARAREAVLDTGAIVVECAGNGRRAVSDYTARTNWARPWSRTAYREAVDIVSSRYDIRSWVTLGRSMGGVNSKYFATRDDVVAPLLAGHIDHSAIYSMIAAFDRPDNTFLRRAYDVTDRTGFLATTAAIDPARQPRDLWQGINTLVVAGAADATVDHRLHGSRFWFDHLSRLGTTGSRLDVMPGRDHGRANGTYDTEAIGTFLGTVWGMRASTRSLAPAQGSVIATYDVRSGGVLVPVHQPAANRRGA